MIWYQPQRVVIVFVQIVEAGMTLGEVVCERVAVPITSYLAVLTSPSHQTVR